MWYFICDVNVYLNKNYFSMTLSKGVWQAGSEMVHFGENLNSVCGKNMLLNQN